MLIMNKNAYLNQSTVLIYMLFLVIYFSIMSDLYMVQIRIRVLYRLITTRRFSFSDQSSNSSPRRDADRKDLAL